MAHAAGAEHQSFTDIPLVAGSLGIDLCAGTARRPLR